MTASFFPFADNPRKAQTKRLTPEQEKVSYDVGRIVGIIAVAFIAIGVGLLIMLGIGWVLVALLALITGGAVALTALQGLGIVALIMLIGFLFR